MAENTRLTHELAKAQQRGAALLAEKSADAERHATQLMQLRAQLVGKDSMIDSLRAEGTILDGEIVALDTTANLLRGMSGITVQISADTTPVSWTARSSAQASGAFGFTLSGYAELESLLAAFREANIAIRELKLGEADLERAFLKLTSHTAVAA